MTITRDSVPALRRGIRRRFDETRNAHILLAPERVIVLDEIATEITALVDAQNSVAKISGILAAKFAEDAGQVEGDVIGFLEELVEKGLVTA